MKTVSINFVFLFVVVCSISLCECCSHGPCSEKDHVEKNRHNPQQPQQHQPLGQMSAQQMQGGGSSTSTAAPAQLTTTDRPVSPVDRQANAEFSNKRPDMIIQNVELNERNDHEHTRGDQRRKRHLHFDLFELGHGHHHIPDYGFHDHHHHDYDYHHHHHHH